MLFFRSKFSSKYSCLEASNSLTPTPGDPTPSPWCPTWALHSCACDKNKRQILDKTAGGRMATRVKKAQHSPRVWRPCWKQIHRPDKNCRHRRINVERTEGSPGTWCQQWVLNWAQALGRVCQSFDALRSSHMTGQWVCCDFSCYATSFWWKPGERLVSFPQSGPVVNSQTWFIWHGFHIPECLMVCTYFERF